MTAIVLVLGVAACSDDDTGGGGPPDAPLIQPGPGGAATAASAPTPSAPAATPAAPSATSAPGTGGPSTTSRGTTSAPAPPPPSTTAAPTTIAAIDPEATPTEIARMESPTDLAWREGDPALYVTEQGGRIIRIGAGEPAVVLDMRDLTDAGGERGLLGLAFAPAGDVAYVNYTDGNGDTVIAEHPVQPDGTFLTGDSSRTVLQIDQPYGNHNGGDLAFGPDGYLYIATGDGGGGGDPERRANDLTSLLGKILRIDPAIGAGQPYTVPEDNPFAGTDAAGEIWALGLRNPWRFSFDRETGDLWIADVGASAVEEVNAVAAIEGFDAGRGRNFGWSAFEGTARFHDDVVVEDHTPPLYTYGHDEGCSITGGVRARGAGAGSLAGWYVFADYCAGAVWALEIAATPDGFSAGRRLTVAEGIASPTAVVEGPRGEVYVLSQAGAVYRLDPTA